MSNAAILLAAGRGSRMREATADKTLEAVQGKPVFLYSLETFLRSGLIETMVLVYRDEPQRRLLEAALGQTDLNSVKLQYIAGGAERQDSVYRGLLALPDRKGLVFIHDAARPLVTVEALQRLARAAEQDAAATLARPVTDTIKQTGPRKRPTLRRHRLKTIDRSRLWSMETPQVFQTELIVEAYHKVQQRGQQVTDDTAAATVAGHPVTLVESLFPNSKVTRPDDLAYVEFLISRRTTEQR